MSDFAPASSRLRVTAPAEHQVRYELAVVMPQLRTSPRYVCRPWVAVRADEQTEQVFLAADFGVCRVNNDHEDDGA